MKLTWFARTAIRIHIGGEILVADPDAAPHSVDPRELVSGADRVFALASDEPALPVADPQRWRPRPKRAPIDATAERPAVELFSIGRRAVLADAPGEPPLALLAGSEPPRFGRWAEGGVVVLFGAREGLIATGTVLLDVAQPRLLALAAEEGDVETAIAELAEHLDGTGLVSLEPGMALEV
ncbi:MAG: hypothetical protein ACTHOR_03280 [Devosia sp.]